MSLRMHRLAILVGLLGVPAMTAAQESVANEESSGCPPTSTELAEEAMSWGLAPYGMMGWMIPGRMMGLARMDYGLSLSPPDRALMLEVVQFQPERVLDLKDRLGLTNDQVFQLEALVTAHWNEEHDRRIALERAVERLQALFEAPMPDTTSVSLAAGQVIAMRNALYGRLVTDGAAARAVLTPQQRHLLLTGRLTLEPMPAPPVHSDGGSHGGTEHGR